MAQVRHPSAWLSLAADRPTENFPWSRPKERTEAVSRKTQRDHNREYNRHFRGLDSRSTRDNNVFNINGLAGGEGVRHLGGSMSVHMGAYCRQLLRHFNALVRLIANIWSHSTTLDRARKVGQNVGHVVGQITCRARSTSSPHVPSRTPGLVVIATAAASI